MTNMLKSVPLLFGAIHGYFRDRRFYRISAPNFVAGAVEGGSTLFEVPYFGRKAYLTQSWQLYAEAAMPALERLYTSALICAKKSNEAPFDRVLACRDGNCLGWK